MFVDCINTMFPTNGLLCLVVGDPRHYLSQLMVAGLFKYESIEDCFDEVREPLMGFWESFFKFQSAAELFVASRVWFKGAC